ncbi:MAG: DUF2795 domain-containing protein [Dehalococcoidia bacterium]
MDEQLRRLRAVLAGQTFPAERWELLATAEFYGADARTRAELRDIPAGRYLTIAQVAEAACAAAARSGAEPERRVNGRSPVRTDLSATADRRRCTRGQDRAPTTGLAQKPS